MVARALIGTHQSLIEYVRLRVLDGHADHNCLAGEISAQGRQAMGVLGTPEAR